MLQSSDSKQYFGSTGIFSEVPSEFTTIYMSLELADLLKINVEANEVVEWLINFKNEDGGFGTHEQSNINSTYYAIISISLLKNSIKDPHETVKFARACEKPYGGFTVIP